MRRLLFILFFTLQIFSGWSKDYTSSITDSLLTVLPTLPHDITRLKVLQQIILSSQGTSHALKYAQELYKEAQLQNNKLHMCDGAYFQILYYYNNDGEQDSISKWVDLIKPIAQSIQYWKVYFDSQKLLINTYIYNYQYEYAFNEASKMLEKAQSIKSVTGEVSAYQCLANIYHETNRWKDEDKVLKRLYELLPQVTHPGTQINILSQLIAFSKQVKNYTDLKTYLDKTRKVLDDIIHNNPAVLNSMSSQYLYVEMYYTYLYIETGNKKLAEKHYEKCSSYITPNTFLPYLVIYQNMAIAYHLSLKEYDTALAIADSAIRFVQKNNFDISDYAEETGYKADILKAMGRYAEALPLYEKATQIEDSLSVAVSSQQLEEIKESYHFNQLILEQGRLKGYIQIIILAVVAIILILCITYTIRISRIRRELKLSEKETQEATRKTKEANEQKSRFLSNMSHAIRVPLNSVVGFSQLIATDTDINEKNRKEYSDIIQQNTEKLMLLVNNVLDLSRLEADMMKYQLTNYDVVQLCNDAVCSAQMQNSNLHIRFQSSVQEYIIHTDCNRIMQMIISTLTGPLTVQEHNEVHFSLDKSEDILYFKVINSPLADRKHNGQESSIRHEINRLLLKHFGGTYQVLADAPEGPTILFTYPAARLQ